MALDVVVNVDRGFGPYAGPRSASLGENSDKENTEDQNQCEAVKPSLSPAAQRLRSTNGSSQ
jgi:hypothetical protein